MQNLGSYGDTLLFHPDDAVEHSGAIPVPPAVPARNPWMVKARDNIEGWMHDFFQAYNADGNAPSIDRFHFDIELAMLDGCADYNTFMLYSMATEPPRPGQAVNRWNSVAVPGFNGQTMADLWDAAKAQFGPGAPWIGDLEDRLDYNPTDGENFCYPVHDDLFVWWASIAQTARDGAFQDSMYSVIKAYHPNCKISNYEDTVLDNQPDTFGWIYDYDLDASGTPFLTNTRNHIRGRIDSNGNNSRNTPFITNGRFLVTGPNHASGDFDAPTMYATSFHEEPNLYLPGHPTESTWDASLRLGRHWWESILNTHRAAAAQNPQDRVTPWNGMVGSTKYSPYVITPDNAHRLFAFQRSKRDQEAMLWHDPATDTTADWAATLRAFDQVYAPQLDSFEILEYGGQGFEANPGDLWDTLRRPVTSSLPPEREVTIQSQDIGTKQASSVICNFSGLHNAPGNGIRIHIEDRVSSSHVRGEIWLWNWSLGGGAWQKLNITDSAAAPGAYLFHAGDSAWRQSRRYFDLRNAGCFVNSSGELAVWIRHEGPSNAAFESRFDLVQVNRINGVVATPDCTDPDPDIVPPIDDDEGLRMAPGKSGPDVDMDGTISGEDADLFAERFFDNHPASDYDRDGAIDAADVSAYITDYANDE